MNENLKGLNAYTAKDKRYTIVAIPKTTKRFGPSGSSKKKSVVLEHAIAVMAKIKSIVLFDVNMS